MSFWSSPLAGGGTGTGGTCTGIECKSKCASMVTRLNRRLSPASFGLGPVLWSGWRAMVRHGLWTLVICTVIVHEWSIINNGSNNGNPKRANKLFVNADWESWWTYEGISGPDFWGRLNPKWSHCSKGKRQSPINIETNKILYDPHLGELAVHGDGLHGQLINTGRSISIAVSNPTSSSLPSHHSHHTSGGGDGTTPTGSGTHVKQLSFHGGPLSYGYTVSNVTLHFGRENDRGSEHSIDGRHFAGELQVYAYNGALYSNWSEAKRSANGLMALAAMIVVTKLNDQKVSNGQLELIIKQLKNITNRGDRQSLIPLSLINLLPSTSHYVTYEGSLTQPACFETVTWILLNRPIYVSAYQFHLLRNSLKGDGHQDNFRPTQMTNNRLVRSNIVHQAPAQSKLNEDDSGEEEQLPFPFKQGSGTPQKLGPFNKDMCFVNRPVSYQANSKLHLEPLDSMGQV